MDSTNTFRPSAPGDCGNSRPVHSNQEGLHPQLAKHLDRHLKHPWRAPIGKPTLEVWSEVKEWLNGQAFILDSGCGVGASTSQLAKLYPHLLVLGVDKSADRIDRKTRGVEDLPNRKLARMDLLDLWRLMLQDEILPSKHFLLYPNPWPKSEHLFKRFHGHPIFATLVDLCPDIELRSNWKLYLEEFQWSWQFATGHKGHLTEIHPSPESAWTPFEKKYLLSQQQLWKWQSL